MAKNTIIKSYKFRICPSKAVSAQLETTLYLCQQIYNAGLQERIQAYKINKVSINYQAQQNQLPDIKDTNPEYKTIHSQVLQNVLKRLDKAFDGFFSRIEKGVKAGFPRFKSISRYDSFTFPQSGFSLTCNKLKLSKIGTVKVRLSREMVGKVKTLTIGREIDKWFVIFTVETAVEPLEKTGQSVGIDAGIAQFITLSDGSHFENPHYAEQLQKKLRVAQRSVSRKKRGSNNRKKAVLKLRKIHQKIKNRRLDFHHKTARFLVNKFDIIAIEKLQVSNMVKSRLARVISDVGWSSFFQILADKVEETGRELVKVTPHYTSQTCSKCGHCEKANRRTQSDFVCVQCHHNSNADINAAENILGLGKSLLDKTYRVIESVSKESASITASV